MRAELVGVSLAIDPGRACYIPLAHKGAARQGELGLGDAGGGDAGEGGDAPDQIPGIGVRFLSLPDEEQEVIGEYISDRETLFYDDADDF